MSRRDPVAGSRIQRCPACGQTIKSSSVHTCPLCNLAFHEEPITGDDVTPYAVAYRQGEPGWRRMSEWVWYSGGGRIKHLALMRASAASRHFARLNICLLAVGLAAIQFTRVGWRWVTASPTMEPTGSTEPVAQGWLRIVGAPHSMAVTRAPDEFVSLWWNPAQSIVATVSAVLGGLLVGWLGLVLVRFGVSRCHKPDSRHERRMTAALHYGTAWIIPIFVGGMLVGLRPISYFGSMARWQWCPSQQVFLVAAAVLAGFGIVMGWLWLIRLGATAPTKTRARVVLFFVVGAPILVSASAMGWLRGLDFLNDSLFSLMKLSF